MKNFCVIICLLFLGVTANSQNTLAPLTVEKIMKDPKWMGTQPSNPQWSADGRTVYFDWNPQNAISDSLYFITIDNPEPQKASPLQKKEMLLARNLVYNQARTQYLYTKEGDVFLTDIKSAQTKRITHTAGMEHGPVFAFNDTKLVFQQGMDLFAWDLKTGELMQLISFQKTPAADRDREKKGNTQEEWLKKDQQEWLEVLRERKAKREAAKAYTVNMPKSKEVRSVYYGEKMVRNVQVSADGRFISYVLFTPEQGGRRTIIPDYVTESGFTEDINGRTKVGSNSGTGELFVFDRQQDTIFTVKTDGLPGLTDQPDYMSDYPSKTGKEEQKKPSRALNISRVSWSPRGAFAVAEIYSTDNKDRWLMQLDGASGKLELLDRQRDEAWIGGPGISGFGANTGWINDRAFWFQSEASGYSHLYSFDFSTGKKSTLTQGNFEVQALTLSADRKFFYLTTNEVHAGEKQLYRLPVSGGKTERLTAMEGSNQAVLSPNEKQIAYLHSYSNKPWELYLQDNKAGAKPRQITDKAQSELFRSYPWRDPELVQIPAADGKMVPARLYRPANPDPSKPAVIFVHGAGYLQNAHKWWSSYFREYMFHNLLADQGYYVLDMDYRGSAGYGRDWRTGIYRHMGGKDLSDHVDGAKWLSGKYGMDPKRIGIYGGSYGGFITLMGLFTSPGTFAAGAALRPVTDWAHYNHGYTSNILNSPYQDSIAYRRSSPIYFAEGLKDHLLICHGVVDVNVHFQDVVRLNQRLIELGKDNWQVAMYPVEDHGFVEPSSWTDEYKRILRLFDEVLKRK